MAPKASSSRPGPARPAAVKPVYSRPRAVKPVPSIPPGATATGLLQLTFGRHANGYGIAGAVAFFLNVVLLLVMNPADFFWTTHPGYWDYTLWLLPAALRAIVSGDAGRLKREPGHPRSLP